MHPPTFLRVLHFNDVYHVAPSTREPVGGAARFGSLMRSLQQQGNEAVPTLTLFSGDAYFPSLESSISRGEHMLPVLNRLDIDAATLGNHEFDQGIDVLESLIQRNNFPWIITNLTDRETGGPAARNSVSYLVKEVVGIRVGIIGIIEKEWLDTLPCLPPTFEYHDFIESARDMATRLKDKQNENMACDLVICLAHMRLHNDIKLADACADVVDLVLSGHDHFYYVGSGIDEYTDPDAESLMAAGASDAEDDYSMLAKWKKERAELPTGSAGRRLVKSGTDFRDLSEIVLCLDLSSDQHSTGLSQVASVAVTRHRVTSAVPEDPEIKQMVDKIEAHLSKALDKVVGYTTVEWDARSTVCRTQESNIGNLSADLMRLCYAEGVGVQIGFLCGGTIRSDTVYPKGKVQLRDIMEIFPFEDPVVVVKLTGDQIRRALENGVSKWPAQEGRFPQVSGIRFEFDPDREPGNRVTSIVITAAAKAAAKRAQTAGSESATPQSGRARASTKSRTSMHRAALENATEVSSGQQSLRRSSDVSLDSEFDADAESDYGCEEDELLDMTATYVVATRDYMYRGHDGYDALNEGELIVDEENGISFSDLYRRFFRGLAVTNSLKFQRSSYATSCSAARHAPPVKSEVSTTGAAEWKRLIIKHADNLRALARGSPSTLPEKETTTTSSPVESGGSLACRIASIVQQYHDGLVTRAQVLSGHGSHVIKALLSSAKRLSEEQEPLRVARTALFGHEDDSSIPLPGNNASDQGIPRNDDAGGLLPGVLVNRKDTRSYASEGLLAEWAVVSPQTDGRIKNLSLSRSIS
ncbi:hypothetical protein GGH94_004048 [Coemansia aciculifera]|uniref:Metallo-dependent phosphatase n=1 Tax=Coemansia aciculifera TaxID=417176 RepID=A0A9W8M571_9FUNG|nr:hypothetical protein GGH94_004048 [Coemansia aciculifera]KAJ2872586.1 hypothetical protein GGH93_003900 [Coemansia aciculifera]